MNNISNLAFIHPNAKIADNVTIDAFAYIEGDVEIGEGCHIHPHVSILNGSRIGKRNSIHEGAVIGAKPQDFRWKGEYSFVTIGDDNTIREQVIINRSIYEGGSTKVGSGSFILAQTHIGHDSEIGNHCVLGNSVKIAGAVKVGGCSILSSGVIVHEGCEIAEWCLIKGGCRVNGPVPPYVIMAHNPISYNGVNAFVLRKGGKSEETIDNIAKCYRLRYQSNTSAYNAVRRILEDVPECKERKAIVGFIKDNKYKVVALPLEDID